MSSLQEQAELKALRSLLTQIYAPQLLENDRYPVAIRHMLLPMLKGSVSDRMGALALISAVESGLVGGIREAGASEKATYLGAGERRAAFSATIDKRPTLFLSTDGDGSHAALSDAVALLKSELKSLPQPQPTPTAGFGCLVHCALCAAVIVDEGLTAFNCLVCLTCQTDA